MRIEWQKDSSIGLFPSNSRDPNYFPKFRFLPGLLIVSLFIIQQPIWQTPPPEQHMRQKTKEAFTLKTFLVIDSKLIYCFSHKIRGTLTTATVFAHCCIFGALNSI